MQLILYCWSRDRDDQEVAVVYFRSGYAPDQYPTENVSCVLQSTSDPWDSFHYHSVRYHSVHYHSVHYRSLQYHSVHYHSVPNGECKLLYSQQVSVRLLSLPFSTQRRMQVILQSTSIHETPFITIQFITIQYPTENVSYSTINEYPWDSFHYHSVPNGECKLFYSQQVSVRLLSLPFSSLPFSTQRKM